MNNDLPPAQSGSERRAKPQGWWSLPGHEYDGTREGVIKAILAAPDVPMRWKEHLQEEIEELGPEYNHVKVNVHVSVHKTKDNKHHHRIYDFDISGSIKL